MKRYHYKISSIIVLFIFHSFGVKAQGTLSLLGQLNLPGMSYDVWGYIDTSSGKEYAIVGNNGLTIIDVSDPVNPVQVANLNTVPDFDIKVWSNYAYCVTGGSGTAYIVNIADPANPAIVNTFPSSHNIFIDDNGYMYAEYPGLIIYDLNPDPVNPVMIWTDSTTGGHDASVIGNRLFDFHGNTGTYIYDICNPANPVLLGSITDSAIQYHHHGWPSKDGNYLYICDELAVAPSPDITIWDISNPATPVKVGSFSDIDATVHNLFVIGDYAYASYYTAGLRVFDLTDPTSPTIADEYDTSPLSGESFGGAFGVYPFALNNKIFVLDVDSGLFIFNVTDTIIMPTGIDQYSILSTQDNQLEVYPNPNKGKFFVTITNKKFQQNRGIHLIRVLSITGQLLYEEEILLVGRQVKQSGSRLVIKKFDLTSWPQGIYVLQLVTEKAVIHRKFILLKSHY
ncbi:MAG: choice-of-anchor B family protein [Cytophagales bacterium]|nr:choice-of-anchor B family protein [Cytophagales bacterium]